jgi:thiamine biosynthesis protein ThiS
MVNHTTETLEILLNGEPKRIPAGLTVTGLLRHLQLPSERVAVEINRAIVRQPAWDSTEIEAGAQIEIVQFVGGG